MRHEIESGRARNVALVGATASDVRDIMVEGRSGLLSISPPSFRPEYEPSKRRLTWPNGAVATCFTAEEPDRLRGPEFDLSWADEPASWTHGVATWDNLNFCLRAGKGARAVVTGTPRATPLIRRLVKEAASPESGIVVMKGKTSENLANLDPTFKQRVMSRYEGTRLGRQELDAELLEDVEGAYWTTAMIYDHRVAVAPALQRVVVALDPAGSHKPTSDYTGLCVAGMGLDGRYYVLASERLRVSPHVWARRALDLYDEHGADRIVGERNYGGDMVESTIRQERSNVSLKTVVATRGKAVRAEPVAALYEQGLCAHVGDPERFATLEEQLLVCPVAVDAWDEIDALVWAISELMGAPAAYGAAVERVGQEARWDTGTGRQPGRMWGR